MHSVPSQDHADQRLDLDDAVQTPAEVSTCYVPTAVALFVGQRELRYREYQSRGDCGCMNDNMNSQWMLILYIHEMLSEDLKQQSQNQSGIYLMQH